MICCCLIWVGIWLTFWFEVCCWLFCCDFWFPCVGWFVWYWLLVLFVGCCVSGLFYFVDFLLFGCLDWWLVLFVFSFVGCLFWCYLSLVGCWVCLRVYCYGYFGLVLVWFYSVFYCLDLILLIDCLIVFKGEYVFYYVLLNVIWMIVWLFVVLYI